MDTVLSINLISSNPKMRGGRPCIAGTGVRVSHIVVVMLFHHKNPGEIAEWFGVTLAQVHAALAYYYEHKSDIDEDIRKQIALAKEFKDKRVDNSNTLLP